MTRRRKWAAGIASGLLLGVVVLVVAFDWNWVKGPVESIFTDIFGRNFEIHGDLEAEFALSPRIVMHDVTVDNADWGSGPHMLEAERFGFVVDLWQLVFDDRLDATDIHFQRPDVLVERSADGELNWQSAFEGGEEQDPPRPPIIGAFSAQGGEVTYRGPDAAREVRIALDQVDGRGGNASAPITLHATGSMIERPLTLEVEAGSLIDFEDGQSPYPLEVGLDVGETSIALAGTITEPAQFRAADLRLDVDSPDLAPLLTALDLSSPPDLPGDISARLVHENQVWAIMDLEANVGAGRVAGRLGVDLAKEPMLLEADLESSQLDVERLLTVARALAPAGDEDASAQDEARQEDADEAPPGPEALLPDIRTDIEFRGRDVAYRDLFFNQLRLDARLQDGRPDVDLRAQGRIDDEPLDLELHVGREKQADGGAAPYVIRASLEAGATTADLSGTFPEPPTLAGLTGRFDIESPKPSTVLQIVGWPHPDMPPLELAGRVEHHDRVWRLSELSGRVDQSDVEGRLTVDFGGKVAAIEADLSSQEIHVDDVRALMRPTVREVAEEARQDLGDAAQKAEEASPRLIADGEINPEALPELRAEVSWKVAQLYGPELQLEDVAFYGALRDGRLPAIALEAGGRFRDEPVEIGLALGAFEDRGVPEGDYPIDVTLEAGASNLSVSGSLAQPMALSGLSLEVDASSSDLSKWLALADLAAPEVPSAAFSGRVVQDRKTWRLPEVYLEVGESNLFGEASVDLEGERPMITADLSSNRLLVSDLAALAPEDGQGDEGDDGGPAFISAAGINLEALPEIDLDATLEAEYVLAEPVRLEQLAATVHLRDRVLVLDLSGEGKFRERPLTVEARLGTEANLDDPKERYAVDVTLSTDRTTASVTGSVGDPVRFAEFDLDARLEGPDLDRLGDILQIGLPSTPPYRLAGNVTHEGTRWALSGLDGRIADSDIGGEVVVDVAGERPMVEADLRSRRLDFDDLSTLVGAPPPVGEEEAASERQERLAAIAGAEEGVLPAREFDVAELRTVDAVVNYRAEEVQARGVPLTGLVLEARLEDGVFRMAPLRFELQEGEMRASLTLDGQSDPMRAEADVRLEEAMLGDLLNLFGVEVPGLGEQPGAEGRLLARAQLTARGNSVDALADTAQGRIGMLMREGEIGALLLEAAGIDVGEVLALLFGDEDPADEMVPVHCFVANASVESGVISIEALVLDTEDSQVTGDGTIDLGEESLDLRFLAQPKDPSVLSASVPVVIEGRFSDVSIHPAEEELAEKALTALGLGVLLPGIGAVIPFIEPGLEDDGACARLLAEAGPELEGSNGQ